MQKSANPFILGLLLLLVEISVMLFSFPLATPAQEVVVASTPLVGAIARAAGAKEVRVISPEGTKHPPEYDLKPSDLFEFEGAKIVIYGGYERMVSKLLETSKEKNILALQIETDTSPKSLIASARKISRALKTEKEEQVWEKQFIEKLKTLQKKISPFSGKRAIVHQYAYSFSKWANLSILQMISPGELTPKVIADALVQKPELVVDVFHFPVARVVADNAKCKYIQIINFPGVENTKTLKDVFEYNSTQLIQAFR
jgi:ABC-type Zn uptake system ZnuABC Zn-binding protein ZnuA